MGEGFIIDDRNIKVNFIGKAQATQVFHTCEQCSQPIIYYGRMIPCKHIFCFTCACQTRETDQNCPRCHDPVQRIEKCPRGAVFVCRIPACRRTYLSQRDLTAHIKHRHKQNEAHAQGLQIVLEGIEGGAPQQPQQQAPQPPPPQQQQQQQPIQSGTSGWSPGGGGAQGAPGGYQRGYGGGGGGYGQRGGGGGRGRGQWGR